MEVLFGLMLYTNSSGLTFVVAVITEKSFWISHRKPFIEDNKKIDSFMRSKGFTKTDSSHYFMEQKHLFKHIRDTLDNSFLNYSDDVSNYAKDNIKSFGILNLE